MAAAMEFAGLRLGGGDHLAQLRLDSDMVLDPRIGLPLCAASTKPAKQPASSPSQFIMTPSMFDADDADDADDAMHDSPNFPHDAVENHDAVEVTAMVTPEASHTPSPKPASTHHPKKHAATPPKTRKKRPRPQSKRGPEPARASRDDAKRYRCLERNRIAASKCREKKKQWVHELEITKVELETQHASLQREYSGLLEEATQIKTSLMAHAACNDQNIDLWIGNEAMRFVQRSNTSRHSSIASLASLQSRKDSAAQSSAAHTDDTHLSSPVLEAPTSMNYDYMPDDMF